MKVTLGKEGLSKSYQNSFIEGELNGQQGQ